MNYNLNSMLIFMLSSKTLYNAHIRVNTFPKASMFIKFLKIIIAQNSCKVYFKFSAELLDVDEHFRNKKYSHLLTRNNFQKILKSLSIENDIII